MTERVVPKRLLNITLMFFATIAFTFVIGFLNGVWIDEMWCMLFLDVIFFSLFAFTLESSRSRKLIGNNTATSYQKITIVYGISCAMAVVFYFFGAFTKPFILIAILIAVFGTNGLSVSVGIFLSGMLCIVGNASLHEMICYCFMILFGCMISDVIQKQIYQIWVTMILCCTSVMVPCIFYYLYNKELSIGVVVGSVIDGCLVVALLKYLYRKHEIIEESDIPKLLEKMVKEDYPMAKEIKEFSITEYNHAVRVSNISYRCALVIGADEKLTAAAGFYYRLGKLEGEPVVANGVRLAQDHFFPEAVVLILSEYGAQEALPSTMESAIVHMVDAIVKKLEVLDKQTVQSAWNQDMVVYQTLNELSAKGIYDKSGLSMNLFLKIREHLVKEEGLL